MAGDKGSESGTSAIATEKPCANEKTGDAGIGHSCSNDLPSTVAPGGDGALDRTLSARHLVFLAIGGCVGTGIFISTGPALAQSGPVSLLLAYAFVGLVTYSIMVSLGEMCSFMPITGCFTTYATRLLSPSAGFSMGWTYFFSWALTFGLEITAAGLVIEYWLPQVNIGIWIAVFWAALVAANFMPVRWIGEFEMWFSSIKVVTILGFFIFGICVNAGVGRQGYIGFTYWRHPGAFAAHVLPGARGRAVGFFSALISATFSFLGSELVVLGAGEAANPRVAIPRAIHWTFWTIFSLFLSTVFLIGLNVPYTHPKLSSSTKNASSSPLVISAEMAGVQALGSIINAVLLTAVLTAGCSNVYSSSRILVGLSDEAHAPAFFRRTNRLGTPFWAVCFSSLFGLLGFLNVSSGGSTAFQWLLNLNTVAGLIPWSIISLCHLRFRAALAHHGIPTSDLPYVARFQPWLSWFGFVMTAAIVLTSGFTVFIKWDTGDFLTSYLSLMVFVALLLGHWAYTRAGVVKLSQVDLRMWQRTM
ncbi:hypothetical protein CDD82_4860 [Ophiocordyceps australis]|uniref:Amino acid permease/ SLC12A domain-containing protein n=1 Tax=Ophiocordyceps australis TaxID=1399860 RepID=A0A2C5Z0V3_9HYPO|nr:hypothetical protein CDD82_4860 [Ophiocordyceps australis]